MNEKNIQYYDNEKFKICQIFQKDFSSYVYIVLDKKSEKACILDPDIDNIDYYIFLIKKLKYKLALAIDTHIHADHVSSLKYLREKKVRAVMGYSENVKEIVNDLIQDGDFVEMGCLKLIAIHTPGHTKDSYCFQLDNNLFTGDTLLINGTGRTDLSTGSAELLYKSLREKILALNENTIIFPAHDYSKKKYSTLKEELNKIKRDGVTEEELKRVKTIVIADDVYQKDSVFNAAMQIGQLETQGYSYEILDDYIKNKGKIGSKLKKSFPNYIKAFRFYYETITKMYE